MAQMIRPISKDRVPFYALSESYKVWVEDFCKMEIAKAEFIKLKSEKETIRNAPLAMKDQKKKLKQAYLNHQKKMSSELSLALARWGTDTFYRLSLQSYPHLNYIIPLDIFEMALAQLPPDPPDALTDDEKTDRLKTIEKKISAAENKIKKYTHQAYIQMKNGNVQCDSRVEFVKFWRDKQAWIARPCDIRGIDLSLSNDDDKWAYQKLCIAKSILPKAVKLPYRP